MEENDGEVVAMVATDLMAAGADATFSTILHSHMCVLPWGWCEPCVRWCLCEEVCSLMRVICLLLQRVDSEQKQWVCLFLACLACELCVL